MESHSELSFQQAVILLSDYENCCKLMTDLRLPDGKVTCPRCGSDHVKYLENARAWKCDDKHESPEFTRKSGTIFEDSPLSLKKWSWLVRWSSRG